MGFFGVFLGFFLGIFFLGFFLGGEESEGELGVLPPHPPSHVRKAGRSSYVPRDALRNVPDPGAMAVAAWLKGAAEALGKR